MHIEIRGPPLEEVAINELKEMWQSPCKMPRVGGATYLASVKVLDDGKVQVLLALPFCLHGVGQELPERPIRPFQQLII